MPKHKPNAPKRVFYQIEFELALVEDGQRQSSALSCRRPLLIWSLSLILNRNRIFGSIKRYDSHCLPINSRSPVRYAT
ncbi:MAG: hypothetical protein QNJ72_20325 [Pleurocapsa sp. MO_226.B13]|nr:hypothetical protein [Pleurocapsa sp. MO_226.B13]